MVFQNFGSYFWCPKVEVLAEMLDLVWEDAATRSDLALNQLCDMIMVQESKVLKTRGQEPKLQDIHRCVFFQVIFLITLSSSSIIWSFNGIMITATFFFSHVIVVVCPVICICSRIR